MAGLIRTTAVAAGCVGGLSTAMYGLMSRQSRRARRIIGKPTEAPLVADGCYLPDGTGPLEAGDPRAAGALRLVVLGDSSAAGIGAELADELPGVQVARGLAEESGRPVRLDTFAVSGSTSRDLAPQVRLALAARPDVALALIGANDVSSRSHPQTAAAVLGAAVRELRADGIQVVVGTCPDLGVVRPIAQPLRGVLHTWSLTLARLQRTAILAAGGHPVPLADLLASEFMTRADFFSRDQFHPSGAGYRAAARVLLPAVCAAVGVWEGGTLVPLLPPRPVRGLDRVWRRGDLISA